MKLFNLLCRTVATTLLIGMCCQPLFAQPFAYQGMLKEKGVPADGMYDFLFQLYEVPSGIARPIGTVSVDDLKVVNGLFTVSLNFGAVWNGHDRYLEIGVRPGNSTGNYTILSPRVKVNFAPYSVLSLDSLSAQSVPWSGITGVPDSFPPGGPAGGDLSGTYPNPVVVGVQGRPVATTAPAMGQVLKWNGNTWSPADDLRDAFWEALGNDIFYNRGMVGVGVPHPTYPLHVEGSSWAVAVGINRGTATASVGVMGEADAPSGRGVMGLATHATGDNAGVYGRTTSTEGYGVYGIADTTSGRSYGVYGQSNSTNGTGVAGRVTATSGVTHGVYGRSDSTSGTGVFGWATATSGDAFGVWGLSESSSGIGVYGHAHAGSGRTYGVYGMSSSPEGVGLLGIAGSHGQSGESYGALAVTYSTAGTGVAGYANALTGTTYGVFGKNYSTSGTGVYGWASATSGNTYGVYGRSDSPTGYGVYSDGRFAATGTKSFQIDHPVNPENAYLNHYSAEGPEPYNIYRGTVVLDARGEAWVQLPEYFEAINRDPSYHLTAVGAPMPNLHVAVEVQNNRFKIAGGAPGKKVSWEVKAIRNDRWVQEYGYQAEQPKPAEHRGKYLHPELYGQPKEMGIHYRPMPERGVTPAEPVRQ